ncbi:ubiquinone biosynthesis regulatory protein kinase UbiB [Pleionea sp. CnH1-48]|uniref:ubiquinone biosynthesis regulatory protein kinase UbiB n=1 Tax=Pleionea sp. CnH1-48 TaxID=2954494 RepID=UPI002097B501|nr:ubiquinone biosynthesis regulatory protein kinase UbiB [Pleionea sp. CnH1-48]MCO7224515.1 ubiquinone biosynthesis regulatory protein kinase UbiB [Pleionea sp. CnH1-48]
MKSFSNLSRLFHINRVLIKYGLDEFFADTPIAGYSRAFKYLAFASRQYKEHSRGARLRMALTELGPIFIKFGQMLSTRRDLLPHDIAEELAQLQDKVPPFCGEESRKIIEKQLGMPLDSVFKHIDEEAMASASMAQVHGATLLDGTEVVVKVIRPGLRKKIKQDLELLHQIAGLIAQYVKDSERFHPEKVVRDYEVTIYNELDLRTEAASATQLRRNFIDSNRLYVPEIYWDYTREKVLVQERIYGIPIANVDELKAAGTNMKELAHRGVEIFFTQVFRDSFFHADMHPGNIFVDVTDPEQPTYIGIDCGIMGTLGEADKNYLAANFLAFFEQDYRRVAELHIESGWVNPDTSVESFEAAIRTACEPIFGKPLSEISFGVFLIQLFQVAQRFQMEVQPQLVLLQKTLLYIEGLGRQLYPQLDLWETAQPFLVEWYKDKVGPKALIKKIKQKWPYWIEELPEMPERLSQFLTADKNHHRRNQQLQQELVQLRRQQKRQQKVNLMSMLGLGLLVLSAAMINQHMIDNTIVTITAAAVVFISAIRTNSKEK